MTYRKLSIRPKLFPGETLTSFLLRVAKSYRTTVKEVWKWFGDGNIRNLCRIDFYLSSYFDIEKICALLNIDAEQIRSASFFTLLESIQERSEQSEWWFLGNSLEYKKRRYCPKCVAMNNRYDLIWQVKEIHICEKHQVYLQDSCLTCNHALPYVNDLLSFGKCTNCMNSLCVQPELCTNNNEIQAQEVIHRQWKYMLNTPFIHSEYSEIMGKGRYIATKLLFLAQNKESTIHRGRMNLTSDEISGLIAYIKDDNKRSKKYMVTLPRILRIVRSRDIDIETLYEIEVPESYVRSIFKEGKEQVQIGTCLVPWCPSFEQKIGLLPLNYNSGSIKFQNEKFKLPHICMYCSLKYGYNQSNDWVEIERFIHTAFDISLPMLNSGAGISKVAETLKTDRFMVYRIVGYLLYHELLVGKIKLKYATFQIEKEPVKFFEILSKINGSKIVYARKNFGWNQVEYYFYYFHSSVQLFLHEAYFTQNREVKVEGLREIKKRKKVHKAETEVERIQKAEIWKLAKAYFEERSKFHQDAADLSFFQFVGKGKKWLISNVPNLMDWYFKMKEELINNNQKHRKCDRLNRYLSTLCELYKSGIRISLESISEKCGIRKKYMRINGLMSIVNQIKDALLSGSISIKEVEELLNVKPKIEQWESFVLKWKIT
ncbi:hypothetical protein A8709_32490 [Paenibacillus pectinilyticus]|uniref:TniQ domain-containing protein n=1 Tax=Paenibacillus pectinilyticus TaxID=512399 RepID=A0A1C0ZWQ5_9BACL|nr:TniQ family protein [Paenibacillus pectinilyticus]OCT12542.1 hypothetical protein A8709_32490 [Paenibacillus pectinilyticus]